MRNGTRVTSKYFLVAATVACCVFGGNCMTADAQQAEVTKILLQLERTDPEACYKVHDFAARLVEALNEDTLAEVRGTDSKNQVTEIGNWPGAPNWPGPPVQVVAAIRQGDLRIRLEKDYLIIHSPRKTPLAMDRAPRDILRQATEGILADDYVPGPDDASRMETRYRDAKLIPGTGAVVGSIGRDRMTGPSGIHVLAKDIDVVIVFEGLYAEAFHKYIYQGLLAAKVRLTKEDAEKYAGRPVLARNLVFDEKTDLKEISDALLNGCMWPIDDERAAGIRTLCLATVLREGRMPRRGL
ncbi:MAG: hypothetical protein NTW96_21775 [Planctomycetia bacterium]|nr:hypothetical protein [Planctomycetia bacterium]